MSIFRQAPDLLTSGTLTIAGREHNLPSYLTNGSWLSSHVHRRRQVGVLGPRRRCGSPRRGPLTQAMANADTARPASVSTPAMPLHVAKFAFARSPVMVGDRVDTAGARPTGHRRRGSATRADDPASAKGPGSASRRSTELRNGRLAPTGDLRSRQGCRLGSRSGQRVTHCQRTVQ